jgi:hypothetical protein
VQPRPSVKIHPMITGMFDPRDGDKAFPTSASNTWTMPVSETQSKAFNIDFKDLQETMDLGVRRASAFMALGLRASNDETVTSLELDANFQIMFMPQNLPIAVVREAQQNFATWVVSNGLRELDQSASIFADRVFEIAALVQFNNRQLERAAILRINRFKRHTNVAGKLEIIADEFEVDSDLRQHMTGLSKARNALSHNRGFVDGHHTTHDRVLRLTWIGQEVVAGDRVFAGPFEPFQVEAGEQLQFRTAQRERNIAIGAPVELSAHDLAEICLTYHVLGNQVCKALERYGRAFGVEGPTTQ